MPFQEIVESNNLFYNYISLLQTSNLNHKLRFYSETFGCQQNENDTLRINSIFLMAGFEKTENIEEADIILFNTCAVREHAEQRVFGKIGSLVPLKRSKPELKIIICGCMVQQKHIIEILDSYKNVDMIFGTYAMGRFPKNLYSLLSTGEKIIDIEEMNTPVPDEVLPDKKSGIKTYLSIMNGCNNFCTYCVVPYVRGREHSKRKDLVINEFKGLIESGYKEIMLLGQNVNSYYNDMDENYDFADLLNDLNKIEGDFRIRFMSSHPKDISKKVLDTIKVSDKVCNYLHLPVQSGSNRILKLMNRHYTSEYYLELIDYAKKNIPGISFTSDIIVGFPGETDEDFNDTIDLIKEVEYNGLFTFIYSPRKNTPAAVMPDQVPPEIKAKRMKILIDTQNDIALNQNKQKIDSFCDVLCEDEKVPDDGVYTGRTEGNVIVKYTSGFGLNRFAKVRITNAKNWALFGKEIKTN